MSCVWFSSGEKQGLQNNNSRSLFRVHKNNKSELAMFYTKVLVGNSITFPGLWVKLYQMLVVV